MSDTLEFRYHTGLLAAAVGTYVGDLSDAAGTLVAADLAIVELAAKTRYRCVYVGSAVGHHTLLIRDTGDGSLPIPAIDYLLKNASGVRLPQSPHAVDEATIGTPAYQSIADDVAKSRAAILELLTDHTSATAAAATAAAADSGAIGAAAAEPKSVTTDGVTVVARGIDEKIEADAYVASHAATRGRKRGLVMTKLSPPGAS